MEGKPGNGYESPFGNGKGATQASGPSTGAHDFLTDPASGAPATGGRDFTKESRQQQSGDNGANPDSIPSGGKLPFTPPNTPEDVGAMTDSGHKPFKITGG